MSRIAWGMAPDAEDAALTFVQPDGKRSTPFYFFNRYDRETVAQTWQVLRSEFDQMLLDNAR